MTKKHPHILSALKMLNLLGLPPAQQNDRSALCLLALLDLTPDKDWPEAGNPLMGITPIIEWVEQHYKNSLSESRNYG